jgi:hypothetical protein
VFASAGQINFTIPASVPIGTAVLNLNNGATAGYPVVLQIDAPPPVIAAPSSAKAGSTVTLTAKGLDAAVISDPSRVTVTEGGVNIPTFTIQKAPDGSSALQIQFTLAASIAGNQIPVTISLDGQLSMPVYINVAAPGA